MARIEVAPEELTRFFRDGTNDKVVARLKEIGYKHVALDLKGYRSGSLNDSLSAELMGIQEA